MLPTYADTPCVAVGRAWPRRAAPLAGNAARSEPDPAEREGPADGGFVDRCAPELDRTPSDLPHSRCMVCEVATHPPDRGPSTVSTTTEARVDPAARVRQLMHVDHVGFTYADGLAAVGDVSLSVDAGEIVSIIGPSGCGKSTLLRMLAGLRQPTDGTIERGHIEGDRLPCSMSSRKTPCCRGFESGTTLRWPGD
ncbi:ATP-binding cassette domain-containing protein [Streptomyces sp. Tu102]|uniref:ATP-binding cassette domain-containing protein n=1 Tax=Streptomyces TaxID=1883 RepID=UPI001BDBE2EC|nr:ATP-binding cassette domain-containing protein [Streptomyces sp. Tu102]MBT1098057.1 ATP-binding cassette domain-containing protein [Streptomyces sp. Tu102]